MRRLLTMVFALAILLGVFGFVTAAPDVASDVPGVSALVAGNAEASTGLFVHRHYIGLVCLYSTGYAYYQWIWHWPDGSFAWLETEQSPYTCA